MTLMEYIKTADGGAIVEALWQGLTPQETSKVLGLDPILVTQMFQRLKEAGF